MSGATGGSPGDGAAALASGLVPPGHNDDALKYPIGRLSPQAEYSDREREAMVARLAAQPAALRAALNGLSDSALDTPYRPGGWTVRQLVHHVADSHLNAYIRVKLGLTEDEPTVKPYDQDAWVTLADVAAVHPSVSLSLLEGIHERLVAVLRAMQPSDFRRSIMHPENGRMTLDDVLAMYSWHGDHHIAHVQGARERNGW
jgi:hypothetical protein